MPVIERSPEAVWARNHHTVAVVEVYDPKTSTWCWRPKCARNLTEPFGRQVRRVIILEELSEKEAQPLIDLVDWEGGKGLLYLPTCRFMSTELAKNRWELATRSRYM